MPQRLVRAALAALGRANAAHPWSHNAAHTGCIVREARAVRRAGGTRVLDVGCGSGELLARLAAVLPDAVGVEPDPRMAHLAEAAVRGWPGARVVRGGFDDAPDGTFDLIVFVAVLHHLPLEATLVRARELLRPGGRLLVVGLAADGDPARDLPSMLLNPLVGLVRHPRWSTATPEAMTAPTAEPTRTYAEIRDAAAGILAGATLRRTLFWRYRMRWVAPA